MDTQGVKRGIQELRALGLNIESRVNESNTNEEQKEDQVRQVDAHNDDQVQPDRVAKAIEAHVLIDRLQEDVGELAPEMAFKAMEMDPKRSIHRNTRTCSKIQRSLMRHGTTMMSSKGRGGEKQS